MVDLEALASRWLEAEIKLAISRIEGAEQILANARKDVVSSENAVTQACAIFDALTLLALRLDNPITE